MDGIRTLLDSGETLAGLVVGTVMLVATLAVLHGRAPESGLLDPPARGASTSGTSRPGLVGPALVTATLVAVAGVGPLPRAGSVPVAVALGVLVLFVAGELAARAGGAWREPLGLVLALPGGALLATAVDAPAWEIALLVAGPSVAGVAAADCDERGAAAGVGPLLALVALAGMYATVPDTELVRAALGAALPLMLLAWPRARARLGRGGCFAFVGLFLWIAVVEGAGRAGSVVGAAACLGLLVLEPVADRLRGESPPPCRSSLAPLIAGQVILVVYFARVAGFAARASVAFLLAVPVAVGAVALLVGLNRRARRAGPSAPPPRAPPP